MKLASFRRVSPQLHCNDAMFLNTLYIREYTGLQAALGITDFTTSSAFCLHVGFPTSTPRLVPGVYALPWLRGPAVEHRSLASVLSLSCARPVADG